MNPSVLYIEDEEDYQILVTRILGRAGWAVATAGTGAEGLAMLRSQRPSLLLLDINLPDTDGYSICEQLRRDPAYKDLPILMLTVRRRPEEWLRGFSAGANDYLSKPFDPQGLLERVQNGLSGQSLRTTNAATPEYQLIQAAADGNRAAFEVLIQKYRDRLTEAIRQCHRSSDESVEDVVSYAFLQAFENLREFRGDASFYTWLFRIALNQSVSYQKRPGLHSLEELTGHDGEQTPRALAEADQVHDSLALEEERARIRAVLNTVPSVYRQVLDLYFIKGQSYEDIAATLGVPLGTVMSRLFKARVLMKDRWDRRATVDEKSR